MCLYPKLILNRKYLPTKKNDYRPPKLTDIRLKYVSIGCGNCIECRKQKAREWQIRLSEEIKYYKYKYFVTLTFSEENLDKLEKEFHTNEANIICKIAIRRFLERYRKKYKKMKIKHWLITELGHNNTERVHIHGIILSNNEITLDELEQLWSYGRADNGQYVNEKTIGYITKYVTKIDNDHKNYMPQIFCSSGIGNRYIEKNKMLHRYNGTNTNEAYKFDDGSKAALPIYYRNHFYSEDEREKLWINKINKHTTYVRGIEIRNIDTEKGLEKYTKILEEQRKINLALGYGDNSQEWDKKAYTTRVKEINAKLKLQNKQKKGKNIT